MVRFRRPELNHTVTSHHEPNQRNHDRSDDPELNLRIKLLLPRLIFIRKQSRAPSQEPYGPPSDRPNESDHPANSSFIFLSSTGTAFQGSSADSYSNAT